MYIIVSHKYYQDLAIEVNRLMKEGYTPIGGVAVVNFNLRSEYYQAMIKQ